MTPAYTIRDPSQSVEIIVDSVTHYVPRRMYIHIRTDMCPYSTVELMSPNFDTLIIEEHNDWSCDTSARTIIAGVTYENGRPRTHFVVESTVDFDADAGDMLPLEW